MLNAKQRETFFKNYLETISGFPELLKKRKSLIEYIEKCAWDFQTEEDMYWINHYNYSRQKSIEILDRWDFIYDRGEKTNKRIKCLYNPPYFNPDCVYWLTFEDNTPLIIADTRRFTRTESEESSSYEKLDNEICKKYPRLEEKIKEYIKELMQVILKSNKFVDILYSPEITKTILKTYYPEVV